MERDDVRGGGEGRSQQTGKVKDDTHRQEIGISEIKVKEKRHKGWDEKKKIVSIAHKTAANARDDRQNNMALTLIHTGDTPDIPCREVSVELSRTRKH